MILTDQLEKALAAGKEAMKYCPNDPSIFFNVANVYGKKDRYKESEQLFHKAIKLFGKSAPAKYYTNLGKIKLVFNNNRERAIIILYNFCPIPFRILK